jgi:hypothetical protein
MRPRRVATTLVAVTAGVTAAVALSRRAERRLPPLAAPAPVLTVVPEPDAVVLPFARPVPVTPVVEQPAAPARCGDSGGRTKSGAPCGARPTSGGRCHHHRIAV